MHVAIYLQRDPDGKRFLATLRRRLDRADIRAWEVRKRAPLTLVHSGERYARIRVTFTPVNAGRRSTSAGSKLGAFSSPPPTMIASISEGLSADRVLGFLVGLLTRHGEPLGVAGIGIPLTQERR